MKTTRRLSPLMWLTCLALLPACGPPPAVPEAPVPPPPLGPGGAPVAAPSAPPRAAAPAAKPGPTPWDPFDSQQGKPPRPLPTLRYYTLPG